MNHNFSILARLQNRGKNQPFVLPYSIILFFLALLIFSVPVQASSSITVNSFADNLIAGDGFCTLREAVINANEDADYSGGDCAAGSEADTIDLAAGTYTLSLTGAGQSAGDLDIEDELIIQGSDPVTTIIDASAISNRVFSVSAATTISGITVTGGHAPWDGGGILVTEANLTVENSIISVNYAGANGGGIYLNTGELTINQSTIADNHASGFGGGIKVFSAYSNAAISNSLIRDNTTFTQGGGIANFGGSINLNQTTIRDNTARVGGGGVYNANAGSAAITDSTINGNKVGTGVFSNNKFGGGIKNEGSDSSMSVVNSTISSNKTADDGGGIYNNESSIDLLNVTIVNNDAISEAGGIDNFGNVTVENSIIAGNTAVSSPDCRSLYGWPLTSNGHNVFGSGTGCTATATDLTVAPADVFTAMLDTLADNGGPTETHALLVDSPALDNANGTSCPTTDQRGITRPRFAGCDIGAFEADDFVQTGLTFTVNNDSDQDDGVCSLINCSLREAINAANSNEGTDTIIFDIPETYLAYIYPESALPEITDPVSIDGYAGDYVILDGGEMETAVSGLTISAGSSTVRGISITNFGTHGILLTDNGNNTVEYVEIYGNGGDGIRVLDGTGNTMTNNNIYANGGLGIDLGGDGVTANDFKDPDSGANNLSNKPFIIRAVPNNYEILVEGYFNGQPNTSYVLEFFNNTSCDASGFGEGETFLGSDELTTNAKGNAAFTTSLSGEGEGFSPFNTSFVTATATDENGNTSEFSKCDPTSLGNDSWPRALELELVPDSLAPEVMSASVSQLIDKRDQSRWFKFQVQPDSKLVVTLTNLPKNYDLTVYKDIGQTYNDLLNVNGNDDLIQLGAEFAPDAFSPDAFSPDAFSPDAFSPDAFSPDAFSPDAFSAAIFSPDAFSPDAFSPDAFSPDAFSPDAFSPDAFSPDAFSPDAFSPDAFSPDAFSPDAFSSAQTRSLLAVSAFNGTAGEGVQLNTWENDGTFYVRVRGRNGVFSQTDTFQLNVELTTGNCSAVTSVLPASNHVAAAGGYNTIFLTDNGRLEGGTASPADIATMNARLSTLAARDEVNAVIVDLGSDARIDAANAQADLYPTCPFAKNLVAHATKQIIDDYRTLNPIEYIVIVGNDDVIPFFRHPDQALLANEHNYVPPVKDNTASQASLKKGYFLSQDLYGSTKSISSRSSRLPIPDIPVGRLVEKATDITAYLDAYLSTTGGVVTPGSALITGYDFLEDAANAVTAELEAGIGTNATTLITPRGTSPIDPASWTADQLKAELLNNRYDISFLAGHFSAGSALAADYSTRLLTTELVASPVDMSNMIVFSAGCHSGYNIVNEHGVTNITPNPDWAQAFAQKGATLIAGTGYQYGDTDFIEYSERLYLGFSENLREGTGPVSIGQALVEAKQEYLAETAELRPLHEKSLLISTIFGLPMLSVDMPAGRNTPDGDSSIVSSTNTFGTNPGATLGLEYADVTVNPSLTTNHVPLDVLGDAGTTVNATYVTGSDGLVINPAEPMLPLERRNINVPGQVLRGVGFRGGAFTDVPNILPLTSAATTEIRGVHPPFVSDTFYPVQPWQVNYFDALIGGDIRLDVYPAQYKSSNAISPIGTLRQFSNMDFRLYYSNYTTQSQVSGTSPALAAPPTISNIIAKVDGGVATFSVRVVGDPAAGIQEVWLVYTGDYPFNGRWQSLDLEQDNNDSTLWQGTLSLNGAENVYYFVQAANGVGLVSAVTNQGAYYHVTADGVPIPPEPEATEISLQNPPASGAYSTVVAVSAVLTSNGTPVANQPVRFGLGAQQKMALTNADGFATANLALLGSPGSETLRVGFGGSDFYLPASDSSPFTINKQDTILTLNSEDATAVFGEDSGLYATLTDAAGRPFKEKTVIFQVTGDNDSYAFAAITDFNGRAYLGAVPLPPGTYTIEATFGGVIELDPQTSIDLTDDRYETSTTTGTLVIEEAEDDEIELVYMSPSFTQKILGIWVGDEDIYTFNLNTEEWEIVFDGSDVGLLTANVNSLAKLEDGTFLMSFGRTRYVKDVGKVYGNDIVRFIPTSLGSETAGTFELYFDGSDVGLNSAAETINAIAFDENGRLLISTFNAFNVNGLKGKGSDILAFTADSLGANTSGSWELYFDGSDVGLGNNISERINALWVGPDNNLYLSTLGKFKINDAFQGDANDIFVCEATSLGSETSCNFSNFWHGSDYGIYHNTIDALWIE